MSVETGSESSGGGIASLNAEEEAYFASGGESEISEGDGGGEADLNNDGALPPGDGDGDKTGEGDGKQAPGDKTPPDRLLAAVREERGKRKGLEKDLRTAMEQIAEMRGRFSVIDKLNGKGAEGDQPPPGPPSAEDDIFGAVKHVGETVVQLQKRLDDEAAAKKTSDEQTSFVNNYRADADAFQAKTPDYRPAYDFLLQTRANELMAIGYDNPKALADAGASQQEVQAAAKALHDALVADEMGIAQLAFQKNKSPAEIIYGLAKQRGYKAAAPADGKGKGDAAPANEQLDRIERGQAANKTLNNAGTPNADGDMTAERLLSMDMAEFETWCAKNPAKAKRIMGG